MFFKEINVHLKHLNAEDLSCYQNEYFDAYTAMLVLHHTKNSDNVIKESFRVLKKGGTIFIAEFGRIENANFFSYIKKVFT
jgi:ubiquinone/menaquinone biosynthesis C-methylase UbiE